MKQLQRPIETKLFYFIMATLLVLVIGGLIEILPMSFQRLVTQPVSGLEPYGALELTGRDIYIREGCGNCHSQMVRKLFFETERYGHYSEAGEFIYDHPFLWGSKRTGPDLARIGGLYGDDWHRRHLNNPREVVPESNMPAYAFLAKTPVDASTIEAKMRALRVVGVPYTDQEIAQSKGVLAGKTEQDALLAYLQQIGILYRFKKP